MNARIISERGISKIRGRSGRPKGESHPAALPRWSSSTGISQLRCGGSWSGMMHGPMCIENRHGEMKMRAFAKFAFHPDAPALRFYQMFGDSQAESRPARLARSRRIDAVKSLKNARLIRPRNADAGVGHSEYHFQFVRFRTQHDFAARQRILPRVIQQILQNFSQPPAVSRYRW